MVSNSDGFTCWFEFTLAKNKEMPSSKPTEIYNVYVRKSKKSLATDSVLQQFNINENVVIV